METIYIHFKATCQLSDRHLVPNIELPDTLHPAPHMEILDVPKFVATALNRLHSESPRLIGISQRMLLAFINSTSTN
jgi:hypothetical protein